MGQRGPRTSHVTRVVKVGGGSFPQVGDPTINNDFSWQPPRLRPHPFDALNGRERRMRVRKENEERGGERGGGGGLFFFSGKDRERTEVARGGAPSVGGPPVELKLMDKGRRASQFSSN